MRIAAAYDNKKVSKSFSRTTQFRLYDVRYGKIVRESMITVAGNDLSALVRAFDEAEIDILICDEIEEEARITLILGSNIGVYNDCRGPIKKCLRHVIEDQAKIQRMLKRDESV